MGFKMKGFPIVEGTKKAKETKKRWKTDAETMHPPYKRPVGPTEKHHYVHKGTALDDNLDTDMRPKKDINKKRE